MISKSQNQPLTEIMRDGDVTIIQCVMCITIINVSFLICLKKKLKLNLNSIQAEAGDDYRLTKTTDVDNNFPGTTLQIHQQQQKIMLNF